MWGSNSTSWGTMVGSILPSQDNAFDFGSASKRVANAYLRNIYTSDLAFSDSLLTDFSINTDTVLTSDNKSLAISGAGDISPGRGGYIQVFGNDYASYGGAVYIQGGSVSSGHLYLQISHASALIRAHNSSNALMWQIDNSGNITQGGSGGGNIALSRAQTSISLPNVLTQAAAGSSISDAAVLTGVFTIINAATLGQGVKFWTPNDGTALYLYNATAVNVLVYPHSGSAAINTNSVGVPVTLAPGYVLIGWKASSTKWAALSGPGAA